VFRDFILLTLRKRIGPCFASPHPKNSPRNEAVLTATPAPTGQPVGAGRARRQGILSRDQKGFADGSSNPCVPAPPCVLATHPGKPRLTCGGTTLPQRPGRRGGNPRRASVPSMPRVPPLTHGDRGCGGCRGRWLASQEREAEKTGEEGEAEARRHDTGKESTRSGREQR
jgi:hypothetical protein